MKTPKTIQTIIAKMNGDHMKLESEGFMPLTVEKIGRGPNGLEAFSICHYGEQEGDLMRDPEICFEVSGDMIFPYYFRNDYAGFEQEVYVTDASGKVTHIRPAVRHEIESFIRIWCRNIKAQGFLAA